MGFFAEYKVKRADKAATNEFNSLHTVWKDDSDSLTHLIAVFTAASKGEDAVPNSLMQKPGEVTLWTANAIFHETGRTPTHYAGTSSGFSIPVVAGIRFRVGAMQGQAIPGDELQMDKDQGVVMLTSQRLIFTGPVKSQEWDFDKVLQVSCSEDQADYFINVSNRQKTSGVRFHPETGRHFNRFLGSATSAHENGFAAVLKELHELEKKIVAAEPKLVLPSTQQPAIS